MNAVFFRGIYEIEMAIEFMIPLYLLVTANFLGDTLSKDVQRMLRENYVAKHAIVFLAILFAFVLSDPNYADKNMDLIAVQSVVVYVLFFMSTKLSFEVLAVVIALLAATYLAHRRERLLEREGKPVDKTIKNILGNSAIALIVIGFAASFYRRR
jgi:PGF-CTERM protein